MLRRLNPTSFKSAKTAQASWDNFRGGVNFLFRETELEKNELSQGINLMLIGEGVPTKRWGSDNYFLAGATGGGRGIFAVKANDGTKELLGITDWGLLTKKNNASYSIITGASWPSGYPLEGVQLANRLYLVSAQRELVRYNFTSLEVFATVPAPTGLSVTNLSGVSGANQVSYRVSTITGVGESLGSDGVILQNVPQDLTETTVLLSWPQVSAPSGLVRGYNIYRGFPGDETWLAGVGAQTTEFLDPGLTASITYQPPSADSTGGPRAKFIIRYQDRLVVAGIPGEPTKVMISGRDPAHERFDFYSGGTTIFVDPDTGDEITGLAVHQDKIIVFKENSVWQITLGDIQVGNFTALEANYHLITASQGCVSHRSIVPVGNDLFFLGRRGIYVLGYEPNILNVLRTNEISVKVRPFFEGLTDDDLSAACAGLFDFKYLIAFPTKKQILVFDRERVAFMGPWTFADFGISQFITYVDEEGTERWIGLDSNDGFATRFASSLVDDKGSAFNTLLKTKKEDFGSFYTFKTIEEMFLNFRNVFGDVSVNIFLEEYTGQTVTAQSFDISSQKGTTGWGTDMWGLAQWGLSNNDAQAASEDLIRRSPLFKTARTFQVEISTSGTSDNYELLGIETIAQPQGRANFPAYDWDTV